VNAGRRFSLAISEGDGISLIARVSAADDAARVEEQGAEAVLVAGSGDGVLGQIRSATSLPVLLAWPRNRGSSPPEEADACLLDVGEDLDSLAEFSRQLAVACELAFRIDDEEQLESALEELDPEIFVLSARDADGEEGLEQVLDLLPDVPAGKLAIAELSATSQDDVGALERAGFDGVIVEPRSVADLVGDAPPEV
jgi:NAD(P)H-dependent flavin oxidoreductase YrpB (nitropropane dioxygenase family)